MKLVVSLICSAYILYAFLFQTSGFPAGFASTERSWTIYGGNTSRYFICTVVLHLLYLSFWWGSLGY